MAILLETLSKNWTGRKPPNSFYEVTITLTSRQDKDTTKRKLQANTTDEHRHKNLQQNTRNPYSTIHEKGYTHHDQVGFIAVMQGFFNAHKLVSTHLKN